MYSTTMGSVDSATRRRRRTRVAGLVLALAVTAPARDGRTDKQTVLLLSHVGGDAEATGASRAAKALVQAMGDEAPLHGPALDRALADRISRSAGPAALDASDRALVEEGRRQFIEGNYDKAIAALDRARRRMRERTAAVASDQGLRDSLHQTLLFLAHAYLRVRQTDRATEHLSEAVRSFSDRDLSLTKHSPELVRFYQRVVRSMQPRSRGALTVQTRPAGCMVFVNERFVGVSPATVSRLHAGEYRVYVQRGNQRGRVHTVLVADEPEKITVDFHFDRHLRTEPFVGLSFDSEAARRKDALRLAARVGQGLQAPLVLLVDVGRHDGLRSLHTTVVASATARRVRSARVALEPAAPTAETYARLGRFLLAGEHAPGIIVTEGDGAATTTAGDPPGGGTAIVAAGTTATDEAAPGPGFFSARVFKWVAAALGAAALGAGVALVAIDGRGTCDDGPGVACRDLYETRDAGIGLLVGSGLLAAGSVYLFFRDDDARPAASPRQPDTGSRPAAVARRAQLSTWFGPGAAGVIGTVRF